jgi:hypothetical protein
MSSDLQPPSSRAAERLAVIVDAAERAALKVIDDAEKEANRYLEEARARADRIVADRLREEADRLESGDSELAESRLRPLENQLEIDEDLPAPEEEEEEVVTDAIEDAPPGEPQVEDEQEQEDEPHDEPESDVPSIAAVATPKPAGPRGGSAAARLLATQMAVSGSTRGEIEMRLRNGFEIEDTSEILDAILGPEG